MTQIWNIFCSDWHLSRQDGRGTARCDSAQKQLASFPVSRNKQVLIRNKAAMSLLYNKSDIDQAFSVEVAGY